MSTEAAFIIMIIVLAVLFEGEPDLHDAIISHLMSDACK